MPDSPELQKRVIEAIGAKAPEAKCPICGNEDWSVQLGTSYLPLSIVSGSTRSWNQNALQVALLICNICGNTHLLNLDVLLGPAKQK